VTRNGASSLRESVIASSQEQLAAAGEAEAPKTITRETAKLHFDEDRIEELNKMAGPGAYDLSRAPSVGVNLRGAPSEILPISLDETIRSAVESNLNIQTARINPALGQQQLLAAQAAFDWTLFADATYNRIEQPQVTRVLNGVALGSNFTKSDSYAFQAGLRKQLTTGGLIEISQSLLITENKTPGFAFSPDPSRDAALNLTLSQPLLRGFGEDVSLAEIRLAESQRRADAKRLERDLLDLIDEAAGAYWDLALAHYTLMVDRRLLERGVETRDVLEGRLDFDVKPAEYSDAVARVESRKAGVMRAENNLRLSSDRLKLIINDPKFPVSGEAVLVTTDMPTGSPIAFDLVDSLNTAVASRPEIELALSEIEDAAIREEFATDALLPQLDLTFQVGLQGLDDNAADAFSDEGDADFVNYTAGLAFERAIGNRGAEATFRLRRLERLQSVITHRNTVQQVIVEVKAALRNVETNYRLIEQTKASRLAASENLRTLEVEEETTRAMTPSFLDLKLTRQEALARAELEEAIAMTDYASSITALNSAMGVALERHGLDLVIPTEEELDDLLEALPPIGN
jgi:outer membrane protein TolC